MKTARLFLYNEKGEQTGVETISRRLHFDAIREAVYTGYEKGCSFQVFEAEGEKLAGFWRGEPGDRERWGDGKLNDRDWDEYISDMIEKNMLRYLGNTDRPIR